MKRWWALVDLQALDVLRTGGVAEGEGLDVRALWVREALTLESEGAGVASAEEGARAAGREVHALVLPALPATNVVGVLLPGLGALPLIEWGDGALFVSETIEGTGYRLPADAILLRQVVEGNAGVEASGGAQLGDDFICEFCFCITGHFLLLHQPRADTLRCPTLQ